MNMENIKTEEEFLENYDSKQYEKPSVTSDILIFTVKEKRLAVLLIKRGAFPFKGRWAIPGGFVQMNETTEETARRELAEETSVKNIYMEQLYTFSDVNRDPRMRIISVAYIAFAPFNKLKHKAGDDAAETKIFYVNYKNGYLSLQDDNENIIKEDDLAFDHAKIIKMAIERIRNKVSYTDIMFEFLNNKDSFTITEVRDIYNAIKDIDTDDGNFRRDIRRKYMTDDTESEIKIIPTDNKYNYEHAGKPASLYKIVKR